MQRCGCSEQIKKRSYDTNMMTIFDVHLKSSYYLDCRSDNMHAVWNLQLEEQHPKNLGVLNVSIHVRVPEQSLVTIAPKELLGSQVLVFVLSGPLFIGEVSQMLSVLAVLQFHTSDRNGSQKNSWNSNEVSDLGPQLGDALRVVNFLSILFLEGLTSGLVGNESVVLDVFGHMAVAVAVGVEPDECAVDQSAEHSEGGEIGRAHV